MNDSGLIRPAIELRRNGIAVATYPLDAGRLSIGRSPSSDIRLENNCVSRCHAAIERRPDGSFVLIDLDSRGGTWLDGWQVTVRASAAVRPEQDQARRLRTGFPSAG